MNDPEIQKFFIHNKMWSDGVKESHPEFFERLSEVQNPKYLWIGCSDSRVPPNEIAALMPGEIFVHRNIGNVINPDDPNILSVLQYSIEVLKIEYIIVCGHYNCGAVKASTEETDMGTISKWLENVRRTYLSNQEDVDKIQDQDQRINTLCEMNVGVQIKNLVETPSVRGAWDRSQKLVIHGMVYSLKDGLLKDLGIEVSSEAEAKALKDPVPA